MNLEFYKKSFKNKFFSKGMDKDLKKQETNELDDNLANHELKEILERKDPELIDKEFIIKILNKIKARRKIGQKEIAKMILFMADFPERNWNIKSIMEGMKTSLEEVNWRDVYSCFLEEDFNIWSLDSLYVIIDCWVCISGIITVPYEIFFKKWKNTRSQIYFIRLIIESDEKKTQLYSNVFFNKIVKLEETRNSRFKNSLNYECTFNCVELFQCIKTLDSNILIEQIAKKAPEWCLAGLSYVYPSFERFFDELMVNFLRGSSSNFIFYILFRNIPKVIFKKLPKYMTNGISLSKILDVILEQKMLPMISDDLDPPNLCLDIIILSSVRDHLNLGIWMNNNLASKKDGFAKILINYVDQKIQGIVELRNNSELDGNNKTNNLMIDKLFPLTVEMILNFTKSIEQYQKQLSFETLTQFNQLKKQIPHVIKMKKGMENSVDEQASTFISSIINSQLSISEGVENIKSMQKGDVSSKELTFKIFSTLIENYSALYKLPNSDLLAIFYGELIKNDIIPKPFMKIALGYIKESLTYPETDREFQFAFKCLESFIRTMPRFLTEIENIEVVKNNLLKKDLILVDEKFYTKLDFYEIIEVCFKVLPNQELIQKFYDMKAKSDSEDFNFFQNIANDDFILLLINFVYTEDIHVVFKMLNYLKEELKMDFVCSCLDLLKTLLNFQIDDEINFVKKIGTVVGKLTLARNRMIVLDKFDFKKFLITSIECRRIFLGVSFICTFLRQGKHGKIFIPKNPWLMSLLNLLGDLHTCTLKKVRTEIEAIFVYFKLPLNQRPIGIYKFKTRDYLLEYKLQNRLNSENKDFKSSDKTMNRDTEVKIVSRDINDKNDVLKHAISLALDFSIREIAEVIIEKACEIAIKTGMVLFKTIKVEKGSEYSIFRNLLINLTKSLCYVSAQEPMRACMSGNITYFLKLVGLEISPEEIHVIVNDNQDLCCNLIQRAGVSRISDCISEYYKNTEVNLGISTCINLKILENNTHVEKVTIKPIDSSEYQELKSHFLQISRRKNANETDFISEEWHHLLGSKSEEDFLRIKSYICKSEDRDIECTKLCKYIIGHLIKSTQDTTSDFLYHCLKEIFKISNRTQKEVLSWIIYSTDIRRFNVNFVSKFIEFQLINLVEYDQALARSIKIEENLDPILNLVTSLLTGEIQICTVYDFIALLEALANNSDNSKIYDFFQRISNYMMLFDNSNVTDFDEFVKAEKYNIFTDYKKTRSLPKNINIKAAFKSSWEHFVRHHKVPTLFCYQKVDMIPIIIKNSVGLYIKDTLEVFIDAYKRRNYLFTKFYTRFMVKLLDILDETPDNIRIIHDVLGLLKPSSVPFFTSGYLEIIQHKFVRRFFDFYMAEEVLKVLNINDRFLYPCTAIFMNIKDNKTFFKTYGIYLSYICNYKYVHLKNIFNRYRDNIHYLENQNFYFKVRRMLQNNTIIIKDYVNKGNFSLYLIDNLNEKNLVTVYASNILRTYINEKMFIQKIIALVWIYNKCECVPVGVKTFYDELRKNDWVMKIIESIESKFNK
jgi:CCR4-NOT transcription complex subunit 1